MTGGVTGGVAGEADCPVSLPPARLAQGTILPGVTRRSICELAAMRGYEVVEEPLSVHDAMEVRGGR